MCAACVAVYWHSDICASVILNKASKQYRIAVALERSGKYYNAITEYKRFAFFLPDSKKLPEVIYRITRCYYKLQDWKNVIKYSNVFKKKFGDEPQLTRVKILEAKALIREGYPSKALKILECILSNKKKLDKDTVRELTVLTGKCYLREGNLAKGERLAEQDMEEANLDFKSPGIAGLCASLVPGLGHIYDGRPRDAWTAIFYTSILSAITWEAVENDNLWLAGVFGTAAATFYSGNIFSAVNMACKHNRSKKLMWLNNYFNEKLGEVHIDYGSIPIFRSETETKNSEKGGVEEKRSAFSWMFTAGISAFRKLVSPIDNKHCPSYPSCSSYGIQAFKKHGVFWGAMLTIDRLIHEPSEGKFSPYIIIRGERKIYDPLEANDFLLR